MNKLHAGPALTIFIIFFGLSVIESFRSGNYISLVFWVVVFALFLFAEKGFGGPRIR